MHNTTLSFWFIFWGSSNGFLAVAMGAFGAHALKGRLNADMWSVFQTAAHYHLVHSVLLVVVGMLGSQLLAHSTHWKWAGGAYLLGILLFSGSLYALAITGITRLGIITPIGGLALLLGWGMLALGALKGI